MKNNKSTYYVGTQYGPDHKQPKRMHVGRKSAIAAAKAQGAPCTIYKRMRNGHWVLLIDHSMPNAARLPLAQHIDNVFADGAV